MVYAVRGQDGEQHGVDRNSQNRPSSEDPSHEGKLLPVDSTFKRVP